MIKKLSLPFFAFLQTTGLVIYIILLSLFINFIDPIIPRNTAQFYGPIMFLLLFIVSALISGLLVLGRADFLFWEKRYRESFTLIGWTVGWGILYLVLFLFILYLK